MELNLHGCRLRVDFSFPAVLALLFLNGDTVLLRQSLLVCLLHEAGHGIAMCLTGAGLREIRFYAAGVQMRTDAALMTKKSEILILLSGPCVNFASAFLLCRFTGWSDTVFLHLGMGAFNLLPFSVLDGGSVLACAFAGYPLLLRIQTILCILLSVGISAFLAYHCVTNPFLYLMCFYLAMTQLRVDKQGGMW